jgi:hypothetical protein
MRRWAMVSCAILLGAILAGGTFASAAPAPSAGPQSAKPKASSFAPRPGTRQQAYGTPIQAPILHRRRPTLHTQPNGTARDAKVTAQAPITDTIGRGTVTSPCRGQNGSSQEFWAR